MVVSCLLLYSGHNILSAEDVKNAILYQGGVRKSYVSVTDVDKSQAMLTSVTIRNIQTYHSVEFSPEGMNFWCGFHRAFCFNCVKSNLATAMQETC